MTPLTLSTAFRRRLRKKTIDQQARILECVSQLGEDWRSPGLHTHKVQGVSGVFEAYVDKANRVTFHWDGDTIVLRMHCDHSILGKKS
jgi:hypothetical protein